jgi:hypothetical protein
MKKVIKIELIDGRIITEDITDHKEVKRLPINTPANDSAYAVMCQGIACGGWTAQDSDLGPKKYKHIAPSQIKTVSVEFID